MFEGEFMKKGIVYLIFLFAISSLAFPQQEVWVSVGYEFGYFADRYKNQGETIETGTFSRGMNISSYSFFTNSLGIFAHGSFLSPKNSWIWNDNGISNVDLSNYPFNMDIGLIIGLAFKIDFTDDFKSYFGIGFNWFTTSAMYPGIGTISYSRKTNNFGIGGDIGLKVDISDRFFLRLGSILTLDFARNTVIETYTGTSLASTSREWNDKYIMLSARPYFAVGLNLFWRNDNDRLRLSSGKPN